MGDGGDGGEGARGLAPGLFTTHVRCEILQPDIYHLLVTIPDMKMFTCLLAKAV